MQVLTITLMNKIFILKNSLLQYPMTFFCIHGNHEERPENIEGYKNKNISWWSCIL